jgi:superfamily I DNA and/or RNA helicase
MKKGQSGRSPEDILIVAPFNAQISALRERLPKK